MRTTIPLEDVLGDFPQHAAMVSLFEDDARQLHDWAVELRSSIGKWCEAQLMMTRTANAVANTLAKYSHMKLTVENVEYDLPEKTDKLSQKVRDVAGLMEGTLDRIVTCVQYPIEKMCTELDYLVREGQENHCRLRTQAREAEDKYLKFSRKNSAHKLEDAMADANDIRLEYNTNALLYCDRLNMLQFHRYTQLIEPVLSLLLSYKSFCENAANIMDQQTISELGGCSRIESEMEEYKKESGEVMRRVASCERESVSPKQGYLRIRMRNNVFSQNWQRFFVYVQGNSLMCQDDGEICAKPLLDLGRCSVEEVEDVDRRHVFTITAEGKKWFFQGRDDIDRMEWIRLLKGITKFEPEHHYPMQFDLLPIGCLPSITGPHSPDFEVCFLGSREIDLEGEQSIQHAMDEVVLARTAHYVHTPSTLFLLVADHRVIIRDADMSIRAFYPFSEMAIWTVSRSDVGVFSIVTGSSDTSHFTVHVLSSGRAEEICSMLAEETRSAYTNETRKAEETRKDEDKKEGEVEEKVYEEERSGEQTDNA